MFDTKCPLCGTHGEVWHKSPETFQCPNCASIYSKYGMVLESDTDTPIVWH
jgi:ribosomal protein S27E